jgi:hypothetical protein
MWDGYRSRLKPAGALELSRRAPEAELASDELAGSVTSNRRRMSAYSDLTSAATRSASPFRSGGSMRDAIPDQ